MIMNNELDKKIKETLENLEAPRSMNWDRMEQRLQAEEEKLKNEAENSFDNNIKEKIAQPTAKYNANHWRLLSRRLDLQAEWRTALYRYKAIEATLMLILLFTMLNFYTSNTQHPTSNLSDNHITKVESQVNRQVNNKVENKVENQLVNKINNNNTLSSVATYPKDVYHNATNVERNQDANITHSINENAVDFATIDVLNNQNDIVTNRNVLIPTIQSPMSAPFFEEVVIRENIQPLAAISAMELKGFKYKKVSNVQKILPKIQMPKTWFLVLSLEKTFNSNRILEEAQFSNNDQAVIRKTTNQGYMARLGVGKGNNRIMTGVGFDKMLFNSISYRPIANGDTRVVNNKVDLRTAHIPLAFEHNFGNGRVEPFIHVGATAHFVIKGKYDYRNQEQGRVLSVPPYAAPVENPLPDGLYYDSTLLGNAYMSFDLGFGATYKLTNHLSLSSQIEYHKNISKYGLGPNDNKITQLQLAAGLRFKY